MLYFPARCSSQINFRFSSALRDFGLCPATYRRSCQNPFPFDLSSFLFPFPFILWLLCHLFVRNLSYCAHYLLCANRTYFADRESILLPVFSRRRKTMKLRLA